MNDSSGSSLRRYPGPGQGNTGYTMGRRRNGMGTAALVLGVVSLVLAVLIVFSGLSLILGPLAIIFGAVGMGRARRGEADNRGHAIAGVVLGIVSLVIVIVLGIRIAVLIGSNSGDFSRFGTCMRGADTDNEVGACFDRLGRDLGG